MALAWLLHQVGTREVMAAVAQVSTLVPLLLAFEAARVGCEAVATRSLIVGSISWRLLLRAQLVAFSVSAVAPLGRATGEALKATMLAPAIGGWRAAAIGVTLQSCSLVVNGGVTVIIAVVAWQKLGVTPVTGCLVALAALLSGLGIGVGLLSRDSRLAAWLSGRWPRLEVALQAFRSQCSESTYLPRDATLMLSAGRLLQIVEMGLLCQALGAGSAPTTALLVEGVQLFAATVGDVIPAQLGVMDGALALTGPQLGMAAATAAAAGIVLHFVQLAGAILGTGLAWRMGAGRLAPAAAPRNLPAQGQRGEAQTRDRDTGETDDSHCALAPLPEQPIEFVAAESAVALEAPI